MEQQHKGRRSLAVWVVLALLLTQGLGGTAGGLSLSLRPDGSIMHLPVTYLDGSPFNDYLVPGLCLLLILGIAPLVALAGMWLGLSPGTRPCRSTSRLRSSFTAPKGLPIPRTKRGVP